MFNFNNKKFDIISDAPKAAYTEFLKDYLKSNNLPLLFNDIPQIIDDNAHIESFENIFKKRYALREIGFYSEEEFAERLASRASEIIPYYILMINNFLETNANLFKTTYQQSETTSDSSAYTRNLAESEDADTTESYSNNIKRKKQTAPLGTAVDTFDNENVDTAEKDEEASSRTHALDTSRTYTGNDNRTNNGTRIITFTGNLGRTQNITIYREYEQLKNIYSRLLNEFDDLFIGIF